MNKILLIVSIFMFSESFAQDLANATIDPIGLYTATGSAIEPSLEVDYSGTSLVEGTDYTASYSDNITTGTATVEITGIGQYTGTLSAQFEIVSLAASLNATEISANLTDEPLGATYSLSGYDASKDYKVVLAVQGNSGATISLGTTTGINNPGLAFENDFTDVEKMYFSGTPSEIETVLNSITVTTTNTPNEDIKIQVYIYPDVSNTFFNHWNGHMYKVVHDASISWTDAKTAAAAASFGGEQGYLITITSQVEQNFTYRLDKSIWIGLSDVESEGTFKWVTGPEVGTVIRTPSGNESDVFELWADGQPNNSGNEDYVGFYRTSGQYYGWRDYLSTSGEIYGYAIEYGTSSSGMNTSLSNVQTSEIVITQKRYLSDATIETIGAYTATGSAIEPSLEVDYSGTSLVEGTDYTASYSDNITTGTATVEITGIGQYTGTLSAQFEIVSLAASLNATEISANLTDEPLGATYSLSGYDASKDYKVVLAVQGNSGATISLGTTTGINNPGLAFENDFTDVEKMYFSGTPSEIETVLNSITVTTTNTPNEDIKIQVYIYPDVSNTFFNHWNGHMYKVVHDASISWTDAKTAAAAASFGGEQGYLITITSQVEQNFTYRLDKSIWIGLSDVESEGTFKWVTGPEVGTVIRTPSGNESDVFELWADGQPNNSGNEDYVGFYRTSGQYYGWRDYLSTSGEIYGYAIEYGTSSSGMNTSLSNVQTSEIVITQKRYLSDATIETIGAYTATGSAVEPDLEVDYFGNSLTAGVDYNAVYSDNVQAGTATVEITGIGDYVGNVSSTFEIVVFTAPSNQNVPLNTQNWELTEQFNLAGYDVTKTYKAAVLILGDPNATITITENSAISFDYGFSDWTDVTNINFTGTASEIESALNSIQVNTTQNVVELKLRVFITSQINNTFLNPMNGHMYQFIPGQITWTNANSASISMTYENEPGYITTLTSENEDNFVSNYVQAQDFWIGLSDADQEGEWYWKTGPEAGTLVWSANNSNQTGFTGIINGQWCNWVTNDPNNATFNFGTGQDYAVAKFEGNVEWNDVNDGDTRVDGYVVEYGTWTDAMDLTFYSTQKAEIILTQVPQNISIQSTETTTSESGSEASFTVVLDINPTDDVTLPINSSDLSEATSSHDQLVFTPSNWNIPQTITITGANDELFDGDISLTIETGNPVSNDTNYNDLLASDIPNLAFTNEDNDGISVNQTTNCSCHGASDGSATVSVNNGSINLYSYSWSDGTSIVSTSSIATSLSVGDYTITVTDSENNSLQELVSITEPSELSASVTYTLASDNLSNGAISLNVSGGTSPYNFDWDNGASLATLTGLASGEYTVIITDNNDCIFSKTIALFDSDNDGIIDSEEGSYENPPTDTDSDGVPDYLEDNTANDHLNTENDTDGDGIGNLNEIAAGSDPLDENDVPETTWQGSVNGDWSDIENWSNGVPNLSYDVEIPSGLSNYPTASSAVAVNSMTLESGASFIAQSSFTGNLIYNRALSSNNWYLVSSPVVGETLEGLISNHTFATGSGSNIGIAPYLNNGSGWDYQTITATGDLDSGSGYSVKLAAAGTVSFNGTFPTSDLSIGITEDANGLNLIGNPYPSYIAANSNADAVNNVLTINSTILSEETLWFWNSGSGSYVTYNQASSSKFVSPAQGFFVNSNGNNSFQFTEAMQSHQSDGFQRSTATRPEINLMLSNDTETRSTDIFFIEGTTTGWDNGYDSSIFEGTANSFAIYTHLISDSEGQNLGIQSLPETNFENWIIPVGINAASGTTITIVAATQNLPEGIDVYLEDKVAGSFTRLATSENYNTTLSEALNGIGRYYLHTSAQVLGIDNLKLENISIYTVNENSIRIVGLQSGAAKVRIYSVQGKQVHASSFQGNGMNDVDLPKVAKGMYLIQLETEIGILNKKIFIE